MSLIIIDGDRLQFDNMFGDRMVFIEGAPVISGSGHATIEGSKICIKGDEKNVQFQANYISGPYTTPGRGIVTILELNQAQLNSGCKSMSDVIIDGNTMFTARFTPSQVAFNPATFPNPTPEPSFPTPSDGKGWFIASQKFVKTG